MSFYIVGTMCMFVLNRSTNSNRFKLEDGLFSAERNDIKLFGGIRAVSTDLPLELNFA